MVWGQIFLAMLFGWLILPHLIGKLRSLGGSE